MLGAFTLEAAAGPQEGAERRERAQALRRALRDLPPLQAEAVRLRVVEELTFAEIGRRFELTAERATMLVAKGLRRLRHPCRARSFAW